MQIPRFIVNAIASNKTSLGDNPAFPPEEEEKFIMGLVAAEFDSLMDGTEVTDENELKHTLSKLISQAKEIESKSKDALEKLCMDITSELFQIPEDTVNIEGKLVESVDVSNQRLTPEKTEDFTFDSLNDMKFLTQEIYKRRFLNAIITGAAMTYANSIKIYVNQLFEINPELPALYQKILKYNNILVYLQKDSIVDNEATSGGKVDVTMDNMQNRVTIKAEGIIFPVLLEETIKGIFELAIAQGLPDDRKNAEYVVKKADFRIAELWDMRLGVPLWKRLKSLIDETEGSEEAEDNFILMELSQLEPDDFNEIVPEMLMKTNEGKRMMQALIDTINHNKELDDFNDFIDSNKTEYPIQDGYMTSDDIILDDVEDDFI